MGELQRATGDQAREAAAVREQPASCPAHGQHPHNGATCLDCPICRPPDHKPAEPEPQQADASPLLDLVRQYGQESYHQGIAAGQRDEGAESHYDDKARALFAHIAALVPQQPVQARTTSGDLIWQHIPCGWPAGWLPDATPDTGPDGDPIGCHKPGPWRPLLVAAPLREPRTWKQIEHAPEGLRRVEVRQPDGRQFVAARRQDGHWVATIAHPDPENAELDETYTWGELLGEGDVTEVLDREAGP